MAATVLALSGLLTVVVFRVGAGGWKKLEAQSTMLADYEVLTSKLAREVQRSVYSSASKAFDPNGESLAFLSAVDDTGTFLLDNTTFAPKWQKYMIFYHDLAARRIYHTHLDLDPSSTIVDNPDVITNYPEGTGNLNNYRTGGRLLMTDMDVCTFDLADSMLTVKVEGSRKRYGDEKPETLKMEFSLAFRN